MSEVANDSPVKVPVRYDEQTKALGYGSWRDADGIYLFQDSGTDENSFLNHKERNEHIALCINEYPRLLADNKALSEKVEKYRKALKRSVRLNQEIALEHRLQDSPTYNECDQSPCQFCLTTADVTAVLPDEKGETR